MMFVQFCNSLVLMQLVRSVTVEIKVLNAFRISLYCKAKSFITGAHIYHVKVCPCYLHTLLGFNSAGFTISNKLVKLLNQEQIYQRYLYFRFTRMNRREPRTRMTTMAPTEIPIIRASTVRPPRQKIDSNIQITTQLYELSISK